MKNKVKIIIVDDNPIFLEGFKTYLNKVIDCEIVACYSSGVDLLQNIRMHRPDLILMDIEMPGLNGIETARKLNFFQYGVKMIAITLYQDHVYLKQLVEAGFRGFVNKNRVIENLYQVINCVMRNELAFPDLRCLENDSTK
jgi:DNA-binding NarL/FixJ family response regulator